MRKNKLLLLLVLLMTAATGARAAWTGGTYTATANENLGAITVNGDATLTINSDVTVTVTGGINVASGTLTVTGPGTLVVNGAKGNNGASGLEGRTGGNGGVAISGNIIVQGGATVTATGGTGGTGGNGEWDGGTGGNGGVAFAGTLTYKSGTVTANGGSAGSGGWSDDEERYASSGSAGKAFANDVDFTQTTGYSVTNGTSTIGSVLNQRKVVISGGSEPAAAAGYTVSMKDGVKDADKWTISPNPAPEGSPVTIQYTGRLKVKGVTATSDAAPAAQVDPLAVPMTIEAITAGSITVSNPQAGMQYSLNGGAKTPVTTSIEVAAGDKVQFYGNGTSITSYLGTVITGSGNGFTCKVYGNIMSLVDEENFATATTLSGENAFDLLFFNNTTLTDASGLLLPATQLASSCYYSMFQGCSALTAAPELPATQLAHSCYYSMFQGCSALTAAPELPATQLAISCYYSMFRGCSALTAAPELPATQLATYCYREMFYNCTALTASPVLPATQLVSRCYQEMFYKCSKLATVTCLATSGIGQSNSTTNWLQNAGGQAQGTKTFNAVSTANWSTGNNGIPTGWERVNVDN